MKNPRYKALILIDCMVLGYFAAHREELFAHIKDIRNATHVYNVLEFMALDLELYEEVRIYSEYLDKKYTRDYRRELDELIKVGGGKMS
jgi:hypothetical protein